MLQTLSTNASEMDTPFPQFLCWAQILILKIQNVFLRLKFSPALNLKKFSGFRSDTKYLLRKSKND